MKLSGQPAATILGVSGAALLHWEKGGTEPPIAFMPAVVRFLGYDPFPEPVTLSDRMRAYRKRNGLSIRAAALRAGVDEESWARWEATGHVPWERYRSALDQFLS